MRNGGYGMSATSVSERNVYYVLSTGLSSPGVRVWCRGLFKLE